MTTLPLLSTMVTKLVTTPASHMVAPSIEFNDGSASWTCRPLLRYTEAFEVVFGLILGAFSRRVRRTFALAASDLRTPVSGTMHLVIGGI